MATACVPFHNPLPDAGASVDSRVQPDVASEIDSNSDDAHHEMGNSTLDGGADEAVDTKPCVPDATPLRLIAPLSTSYASTVRPTLKWEGGDKCGTTIDLCWDSACADVIQTLSPTRGTFSARPSADLPHGVVYWRAHSGPEMSPVWSVFIAKDTAVDSAGGTFSDFNGDGRSDVAVMAQGGAIFVYYGGPGGLRDAPTTVSAVGATALVSGGDLASAGDVSGDGFGDLVVVAPSTSGGFKIQVFLGSQSGVAQTPSRTIDVDAGGSVEEMAVRGGLDINGDGYGDLVVEGSVLVPIFGGPTAPAAGRPLETAPLLVGALSVCDVNGDGIQDVAVLVSTVGGPAPAILRGTGTSFVSTSLMIPSHGTADEAFARIQCVDARGDGYPELVAAAPLSAVRTTGVGDVLVFENSKGVLAKTGVPIAGLDEFHQAGSELTWIGDMNADGVDELAIGFSGEVEVAQITFDALSADPLSIVEVTNPQKGVVGGLAGGDYDGDGYSDLVVGFPDRDPRPLSLLKGSRSAQVASPTQIDVPAPNGAAFFGYKISSVR